MVWIFPRQAAVYQGWESLAWESKWESKVLPLAAAFQRERKVPSCLSHWLDLFCLDLFCWLGSFLAGCFFFSFDRSLLAGSFLIWFFGRIFPPYWLDRFLLDLFLLTGSFLTDWIFSCSLDLFLPTKPFLLFDNRLSVWILTTDWLFCSDISLLAAHFVFLIPLDWLFCTGIIPTDCILCTELSLLTDCFALNYLYWPTVLHWNVPTDWLFCTEMSDCFALKCPYWLTVLHWNVPTDWLFCTGIIPTDGLICTEIPLLTDYFVLE